MDSAGKGTMNISIRNAIAEGAQLLHEAGVAEARRESGSLAAHAIGRDRTFVVTHADEPLEDAAVEAFRKLIERRAAGEPLQYLTGHQEFFKLDFEVTPDVLIPRPETELMVEIALELLKNDRGPFIADIGTGSGCVAISLLDELRDARAIATDISAAALCVAQRNAERHGVNDRLILLESEGFSAVDRLGPFALIASNPPYLSDDELEDLQREVRQEPRAALAAGTDGLSVIRRLLSEAPQFLRRGGYFVFEIGFGQSSAVEQLIDRRVWDLLEIREDLQGIPRTFVLQKK
jgi:release factor glutamine methyltransferase